MSKSTEDLIGELESGGVLGDTAPHPLASAPAQPAAVPVRAPRSSPLILVAVLIIAVLGSLPFGSWALYPIALLVTLIHETSHAVAAAVTGGSVLSLSISPDLSGVTQMVGGFTPVIASAGYLGATLAGCSLLLIPPHFARWAVGGLAVVPLAALLLFHPASIFTGVWALLFAVGLAGAAWKLSTRLAAFLQIFLGVEAGLNAFRDLLTLLLVSSTGAHIQSDAQAMSNATFFPPFAWALIWTILSLVALALVLRKVARRDLQQLVYFRG